MDTERIVRLEELAVEHKRMHLENQLRIAAVEDNMRVFGAKLDANTRDTHEIKAGVGSVVDTMAAWDGAMKVIGWVAKPITGVITICGILAGIYFGFFPKK